jgi:hypothetical protein
LLKLTRQQLYELVWSKPMRDAAATIPMSDVGLKKVCCRQGVPVPPRGYWNKVRAGHRMPPRPPLPLAAAGQTDDFQLFAPPPLHGAALESQKRATAKIQGRPRKAEAALAARAKRPPAPHAAPQPTTKSKTRRRKKRRRPEETSYVVPIDRWEWEYSFGVTSLGETYANHR